MSKTEMHRKRLCLRSTTQRAKLWVAVFRREWGGLLAFALFTLWTATSSAALENGPGQYVFQDSETGKAITVWYLKPASFSKASPVVMVLHGVNRNAKSYRDSWEAYAEDYGFMILAPEFSEELFPGNAYAQGNYFRISPAEARKAKIAPQQNPIERWSFGVPDKVFADFVARHEKVANGRYYLFGHSAGAQFIHRMLQFLPSTRVKMAVAANAGWYTLPDRNTNWPYGLKGTSATDESIRRFMGSPLVLLLGEEDTDSRHPELRRTDKADEQGTTRLERGRYFFEFAADVARKLDTPFGWRLQTVPGASHSQRTMAGAAAALFANDERPTARAFY